MPYYVPVNVAVTTALAAGGVLFGGGGAAPPGATPVDLPVNRVPVSVAAGGQLLITWPAVPANQQGLVTAIGVAAADFANARITTRVGGVAVAPLVQVFGAVGPLEAPTPLAVPIRMAAGQVFSLLIENVGGAPQDMAARTLGWTG